MIATKCSSCRSKEIVYRNALIAMAGGLELQVEFGVCSKHSALRFRIAARKKAERKMKRLERVFRRGIKLSEEKCLICDGTGRSAAGERCWHCEGRGKVFSGYSPVNQRSLTKPNSVL